jgi:hypothetical protein
LTKRLKHGAIEHTHPLWLRVLAYACLLLVVGASSVQAVHIHGQWLPQRAAQVAPAADGSQLPGGEENCPLCMAMHSALPVVTHLAPARLVLVVGRVEQVVDRIPDATWHFAMFSRPPPVETI